MTITLKDPYHIPQQQTSKSSTDDDADNTGDTSSPAAWAAASSSLSLASLNPDIAYSVRSSGDGPFPKILPALKMLSATVYYKYDIMRRAPHAISAYAGLRIRPLRVIPKRLPRRIIDNAGYLYSKSNNLKADADAGVDSSSDDDKHASNTIPDLDENVIDDYVLNVSFSPTFSLRNNAATAEVNLWGEDKTRWNAMAKLNLPSYNGSAAVNKKKKQLITFVRASCKVFLPFTAVSSLTFTPSYDPNALIYPLSCQLTGESGAGRTSAVLNLNIDDPTLSLIHQLDDRNVIAPEISLHTAKIMYNWTTQLASGILRTRVDPTSAIQVTWVDKAGAGRWVTDFKLPLEGSAGPLAADIRVQRQFVF
eukprot:CAMPEP_0196821986 /NCGR_PEP_ID=MMETSP1362-20130617/81752_1 /TAXON_ID=163516 /ORGANISM="Leptocylindrus danicus, Strain CCMP1856" /LENGTH=364 /DNA_ID=CAMNT_0042201395 /DNA_START=117 /DNA_END=1211 /DNA_ORIENTATION=-